MLRTGLAALMIFVMSTAGATADEAAGSRGRGLIGWLTPVKTTEAAAGNGHETSGVRPAVVVDAEREAPEIRRTSDRPAPAASETVGPPLNSLPIELAPPVPNTSAVAGPQYFSVSGGTSIAEPVHPGRNWQQYAAPAPVQTTAAGIFASTTQGLPSGPMRAASASSNGTVVNGGSGYGTYATDASGAPLRPGSALYPAPIPGIPQQMGGTAISNQFLNPHEMIYGHRYRALYPPYYYKVNGKYAVTPFGVWSHEDWYLQGTMVDVKYHSHKKPFTFFYPNHRY